MSCCNRELKWDSSRRTIATTIALDVSINFSTSRDLVLKDDSRHNKTKLSHGAM